MSPIDKLVYWINERDAILQKKIEGEEAPWSSDITFQTVYFCNVRREDDKVTMWIREHYDWKSQPMAEFNMIVARLVNKPSSLESMGWPFTNWGEIDKLVFLNVMSQPKAWGGAYIVSTNGRSVPKHDYIRDVLTAALPHLEQVRQATTLAAAHTALVAVQGLGSFMAAQIVADLKNTNGHQLYTAADWWTWCAHGPGSLRGLAWVNETDKCSRNDFTHCISLLREYIDENINQDMPKFCNQDLQNCLCEFDKYMRVSTGVGRSKRKYTGK